MRAVTRGQVKVRAQQLANVFNDPNVSDSELNELFNLHLAALYDLLISAGPADYYSADFTITTAAGTIQYPLSSHAPDFLSLTNVLAIETGDIPRPLYPMQDKHRGQFKAPSSQWNVTVEYLPTCPVLTDDAQTFDGVDGWDELVSARMARDIMAKREADASIPLAIINSTEQRIRSMSTKRDRGGPRSINDVESNFSWWPPTVRLGAYRLRGGNLELYESVAVGWP